MLIIIPGDFTTAHMKVTTVQCALFETLNFPYDFVCSRKLVIIEVVASLHANCKIIFYEMIYNRLSETLAKMLFG